MFIYSTFNIAATSIESSNCIRFVNEYSSRSTELDKILFDIENESLNNLNNLIDIVTKYLAKNYKKGQIIESLQKRAENPNEPLLDPENMLDEKEAYTFTPIRNFKEKYKDIKKYDYDFKSETVKSNLDEIEVKIENDAKISRSTCLDDDGSLWNDLDREIETFVNNDNSTECKTEKTFKLQLESFFNKRAALDHILVRFLRLVDDLVGNECKAFFEIKNILQVQYKVYIAQICKKMGSMFLEQGEKYLYALNNFSNQKFKIDNNEINLAAIKNEFTKLYEECKNQLTGDQKALLQNNGGFFRRILKMEALVEVLNELTDDLKKN